jgi:hypothetical protein
MGPLPRARRLSVLLLALALAWPRPDAAADPGDDPSPEPSAQSSFLSLHRRALLIATGAGAAGTGIAAIVLRRQANEKYEEYQATADPEEIAALYDETTSLDNQAAACFIAAEALFVAALYLGFFVEPAPVRLEPVPAGLALTWHF